MGCLLELSACFVLVQASWTAIHAGFLCSAAVSYHGIGSEQTDRIVFGGFDRNRHARQTQPQVSLRLPWFLLACPFIHCLPFIEWLRPRWVGFVQRIDEVVC